jgi:hypothetical protein
VRACVADFDTSEAGGGQEVAPLGLGALLAREHGCRCPPTAPRGNTAMQDIMIRIQTDDFEAWKQQHYLHAANRARYGLTDGPAYRDLDDPGAALFHISVEDMDTAMGWFSSDTFKEATKLAKVTDRRFYLAQPRT